MKISVDGMELELLVGSDPEVFVKDNERLISAHGLVPGTKENPHKVKDGAIQVDGMALEFNIEPAKDANEFVKNINSVLGQLSSRLPKNLKLAIIPTAEFGKAYIDSQPEIAKELGCSSDFNAYTGKENPKPNAEAPFRTAAGHIHIGWTEYADIEDPQYLETCCEFTKVLDLYLGVPSILTDSDTKRRDLYGAAGAFRPKAYGLEYRVLSNYWLKDTKSIKWVYSQVEKAIKKFLGGFRVSGSEGRKLQQIIKVSAATEASALIQQHSIEVPSNV